MSNTQSNRAAGARTRASRSPKHKAEPIDGAEEASPAQRLSSKPDADSSAVAKARGEPRGSAPIRRRRPVVKTQTAEAGAMALVTPLQWRTMVAEAAYFRAEQRGFAGGSQEQDWYEAEEEIRRSLEER